MARKEVVASGGQKFVLNQTVTGLYRGMREGQYGPDNPLVDIEIDGVVQTFYGKKVLANKLHAVPEDVEVEITWLGLKPNKKQPGKTFNDYTVFYDDGEPEQAAPAPAPAPKPAASAPKPAAKGKKASKPAAPPTPPAEADDEVPF